MNAGWQFNTAPWVMGVAAAFVLASAWFFFRSLRREGRGGWMTCLHVLRFLIALAIACTKAVIVILFFMHVKYQSRLIKMTVASGFFTFVVLGIMTLSDYISRAWGRW